MDIELRYFALIREIVGQAAERRALADGATVMDLMDALVQEHPRLERMRPMTMVMVNQAYVAAAHPLREGDEVALIPPVSGGAAEIHARVSTEPLSLERIAALVVRPAAGAVVSFQGITREVESLEYEAYAEMAEERIAAILIDCCERHDLEAAAAEHRTGTVPLGEPSVIVAVAAGHRGEAFAGAREAIDRIKAEAPIWKQEVEGGEARWVEGTKPA